MLKKKEKKLSNDINFQLEEMQEQIYFKIYKKLETFSFHFSINSIYHPPEMDILEGINSAYVL